MDLEVRWRQRFASFRKALSQLGKALEKYKLEGLNELEKQGLIQAFEYTFELAWNLLRDYLLYQGITEIRGSRDAIKMAFKYGLIQDGETWLKMLSARNLTSHTYQEEIVKTLLEEIVKIYFTCFENLRETFEKLEKSAENE